MNRFKKNWNEIFPQLSGIKFSMEECPMLIGIRRQFSSLEYEVRILLIHDVLQPDGEELDLDNLLFKLITFKEEFDTNKKLLVSLF